MTEKPDAKVERPACVICLRKAGKVDRYVHTLACVGIAGAYAHGRCIHQKLSDYWLAQRKLLNIA